MIEETPQPETPAYSAPYGGTPATSPQLINPTDTQSPSPSSDTPYTSMPYYSPETTSSSTADDYLDPNDYADFFGDHSASVSAQGVFNQMSGFLRDTPLPLPFEDGKQLLFDLEKVRSPDDAADWAIGAFDAQKDAQVLYNSMSRFQGTYGEVGEYSKDLSLNIFKDAYQLGEDQMIKQAMPDDPAMAELTITMKGMVENFKVGVGNMSHNAKVIREGMTGWVKNHSVWQEFKDFQ